MTDNLGEVRKEVKLVIVYELRESFKWEGAYLPCSQVLAISGRAGYFLPYYMCTIFRCFLGLLLGIRMNEDSIQFTSLRIPYVTYEFTHVHFSYNNSFILYIYDKAY